MQYIIIIIIMVSLALKRNEEGQLNRTSWDFGDVLASKFQILLQF